jgi:hypothetical protein
MWLRLQKAKERQPERLSLKAAAISRTKPKANRTLTATAWRMLEAATGLTAEIAAVAAVVPVAAVVIVVAAVAVEGPVVVGEIVDGVGLAGEDTKLSLRESRGCFAIQGPRVVASSGKRLPSSAEAGTICDAAWLKPCLSRSKSESTTESKSKATDSSVRPTRSKSPLPNSLGPGRPDRADSIIGLQGQREGKTAWRFPNHHGYLWARLRIFDSPRMLANLNYRIAKAKAAKKAQFQLAKAIQFCGQMMVI